MTIIKVALTNLGKYNEGELVYTWLELPATDEEIEEAFEEIGVADNTQYEEYFFSDHEAPQGIDIGEYESLDELNEFAEKFEEMKNIDDVVNDNLDADNVINFAHEAQRVGLIDDAFEFIDRIITDEQLDEMVRERAEGGWQGVKNLLHDVTNYGATHFYLGGDANVEDLEYSDLEGIIYDIMNEINRNK